MSSQANTMCNDWVPCPHREVMLAANVHPDTRLATDFLNPFNEYIMLAELVADGSMETDVLGDWLPIDYETHFARSGFAGLDVVLAAFRSLPCPQRRTFEDAVNALIDLIVAHQSNLAAAFTQITPIKHARDQVSALICDPAHVEEVDNEATQAAIDALFD